MTDEEFLAEFGHVAAAPGGVGRLRRLILDLAVRGRLVEQDQGEAPAGELLARIAAARTASESSRNGARDKQLGGSSPDRFSLPPGWAWSTLGELALSSSAGWSPKCQTRPAVGSEWGILKTSAVTKERFIEEENKALAAGIEPRTEHLVRVGDFIVCRANTQRLVGRGAVVESVSGNLLLSDKHVRFEFFAAPIARYVHLVNSSSATRKLYEELSSGMASSMVNITRVQFASVPIPLPPLEEQHRIVARVDELMALCDEIEESQKAITRLRAETSRSALAAIVESDRSDPDTAVRIIQDHLRLCLRPGDGAVEVLGEVRNAILALAIRGQLVEPGRDGPPGAWAHATLADLTESTRPICYGVLKPGEYVDGGTPLVRIVDVAGDKLDISEAHRISLALDDEFARSRLAGGEVLLSVQGTIGRVAVVPEEAAGANISRTLAVIDTDERADAHFVRYWLMHLARSQQFKVVGTTRNSLNIGEVRKLSCPLPPLEEQHRIVAHIDELMALCDEIEAALTTERELASEFADSAIGALLAERG